MHPGMMRQGMMHPGMMYGQYPYAYDSHMMTRPAKVAELDHRANMNKGEAIHLNKMADGATNHDNQIHALEMRHLDDQHRKRMHILLGDAVARSMYPGFHPHYGHHHHHHHMHGHHMGMPMSAATHDPLSQDRQARQIGNALADSLKGFIDKKLDQQPAKEDAKAPKEGKTAKVNLK